MANEIADKLDTDERSLSVFLSSIEGKDPHDWVNDVGIKYGRPVALFGLASLWVENNFEIAEDFVRQLHDGWA
jgi:hypothetical protein